MVEPVIARLCWLALILSLVLPVRADQETSASAEPVAKEETPTPEAAVSKVSKVARLTEIARHPAPEGGRKARVYVIPIQQEINQSALFILRSGLKEAIDWQADLVVLNMDTPGGALDVTLEMMKLLDRFQGRTATFVDENGLSAGAFISSATRDIYFSPNAVVGSAAPVQGGGEEIGASMREKIMSFLKARVRAIAGGEEHRYRADVVTAMMDDTFELKVEGRVLKEKGKLLALTGDEATELFGDPAQPLFASGVSPDLPSLLNSLHGEEGWERKDFQVSWSVDLARFLTSSAITSLLLGAGILCLYLEFKTPGFGVFGISGTVLLGLVFFGHHVAGLSGHEPIILFGIGLALVIVELFIFPGTLVAGVSGAALILGSLVWAMADVWPQSDGTGIEFDPSILLRPIGNLTMGLLVAGVGAAVLWKILPRTPLYGHLVLETEPNSVSAAAEAAALPAVGSEGVVISDLRPGGEVEIAGKRYEAMVVNGFASAGSRVRVVSRSAFALQVESLSS